MARTALSPAPDSPSMGALATARGALVRAFDDDPIFRFLFPKAPSRARWLDFIMALTLDHCARHGDVLFSRDGAAGGASGLVEVGEGSAAAPPVPTLGSTLRFAARRRARPALAWPTWPLLRRGLRIFDLMERAHVEGPHLYLAVVAVAPDHQGRGLGGSMLRAVLERAEGAGLPTYLETSNPVNLPLYRRFGFVDRDELVAGPGVPPVWTMMTA